MNLYNKYLNDFKEHYILYIPLSIILQSCIGSIAAMYILMNSTPTIHLWELTMCVVVSMTYNAVIYAQLSRKWVFNFLILTFLVNVPLIIINVMRLQ
jgi:hypothetical protein